MTATSLATESFRGLYDERVLRLATRGELELLEHGLADNVPVLHHEQRAILATHDGIPAGVVLWVYYDFKREIFVCLSYVSPAHRRCGVYRFMWSRLLAEAREVGARAIRSSTSADNAVMRAVARSQGRREIAVTLECEVPPCP